MCRIHADIPIGGALIDQTSINGSGGTDPAACGRVRDNPAGMAGFAWVIRGGTLWAAAFFCVEKCASAEK